MSCSGRSPGLGCSANTAMPVFFSCCWGARYCSLLRARLLDWRLLLSVGAAAVVAAPFVAWLIEGRHDLVALSHGSACRDEPPQGHADWAWQGDLCAARFLFPLDLIVLMLFPGMLPRLGPRSNML